MTCPDCPHHCASRGPRSVCGIDRPGRIYWQGVTMLEEHELAPTYEIYFTGCSLRCRFCTVPQAIERPQQGRWLEPSALVDEILGPQVPPFRTLSLVGGDPSVNRPYVAALVPILRRRAPDLPLVLNTNLFSSTQQAASDAADLDWIVGDLHFWQPDCAAAVAGVRSYPDVARRAAECMAAAGGQLILRVLVLPGHLDCCARPTITWAAALSARHPGRVFVHLMTHYAPAGHARGDAQLGRVLRDAELLQSDRLLAELLPEDLPRLSDHPLLPMVLRSPSARDTAAPIEIDAQGRVLLPFVTGELLPLASLLQPSLAPRRVYLGEHS